MLWRGKLDAPTALSCSKTRQSLLTCYAACLSGLRQLRGLLRAALAPPYLLCVCAPWGLCWVKMLISIPG